VARRGKRIYRFVEEGKVSLSVGEPMEHFIMRDQVGAMLRRINSVLRYITARCTSDSSALRVARRAINKLKGEMHLVLVMSLSV